MKSEAKPMLKTTETTAPLGALSPEDERRLDEMFAYVKEQAETFVGYPCRGRFDYSPLHRFLNYPINNVGDPFAPSTYRVHTREIELEVLAWFAELTHISAEQYWGYVTNGGTEGNIYGLFLARELYPSGMVYYSEDTHYSVAKNLRVLNMKHIMIKAQPNGEIDYDDLYETIRIHRDVPPIVFANVGTTMTEAVDDVTRIRRMLRELAIPESYIHCDAALCGMTLPFLDGAPEYDFRAGIDSISISGHKFIGSPIPCGVVLAKKRYVDRIARSIEYVGTLDTTLTGSRNGISPLVLWYAIRSRGADGFRREVAACVEKAKYAVRRLREIGMEAWRNPFAITVVFERPAPSVLQKWQIAVQRDRAHIITMQTISKEQIDELVSDIEAAREEVKA
ncbi:MAG: histidine decarboxylase [Bryobacteraceae bacterium]|nr:histidine decarboxylase [Bryobacteraceae bacterium]